jgi:hypothetical protein
MKHYKRTCCKMCHISDSSLKIQIYGSDIWLVVQRKHDEQKQVTLCHKHFISIKLDALENSEFQNGKKRKTSLCLGFPVCFQ